MVKYMTKQMKTFYDWCIETNNYKYLDNWDYDVNQISPKEISHSSRKKMSFKCPCGRNHDNTFRALGNIVTCFKNCNVRENYCAECNSFGQWCIDNNHIDILDLWDYEKNIISPFKVPFNSNYSYYFKCKRNLHESHKHTIYAIINSGNQIKCPKCNSIAQWGIDNVSENFLEEYWSDKNEVDPYTIAFGSRKKIWIKCQICNDDYLVKAYHFSSGVRHGDCALLGGKSKLQKKVSEYIKIKYSNYTLLHERDCTIVPVNPTTSCQMPFDNEIKELKLIIEVHGVQHYQDCSWYKVMAEKKNCTSQDIFLQRQEYDLYKKTVAESDGYFYLEIPYWTENDESYKALIDNKIDEIL